MRSVVIFQIMIFNKGCGHNEHTCNNGRCISAEYECDNEDDCGDGSACILSSDEAGCGKNFPDYFFIQHNSLINQNTFYHFLRSPKFVILHHSKVLKSQLKAAKDEKQNQMCEIVDCTFSMAQLLCDECKGEQALNKGKN